jgi:hypothetical protein
MKISKETGIILAEVFTVIQQTLDAITAALGLLMHFLNCEKTVTNGNPIIIPPAAFHLQNL